MKKTALPPLFALHFAVFLFGTAGVLGKMLAVSSLLLVFGRTLFAALCLIPVLVYQRQLHFHDVSKRVVLCGFLLAVHWLTFFASLNFAPVAFGLMGFASFPLFVAMLEPWFFKEPGSAHDAWAAVLVVAGMAMMVSGSSWNDGAVFALGLGILSGFSFALLAMVNRWQGSRIPPFKLAFLQNGLATVLLLPLVLASGDLIGHSAQTWLGLVLLGTVFTALSHGLFMSSLRHVSASFASIVTSLEPVYGMLLAFLILQETPGIRELAGASVILAATAYASYQHQAHEVVRQGH
ncbi:DMT family transporter [Undibacterium sp. TS12]|uniref:DMT family transporter n=1 Tax=Undibacterium sp. TS12 TaxID=2908202 RepID=UPI001F4C663A|nr:DMT family transporter [Undibacterium sp. TS12]MCH8618439.1 DMT family transporter [Undibacterium sp. TS12]